MNRMVKLDASDHLRQQTFALDSCFHRTESNPDLKKLKGLNGDSILKIFLPREALTICPRVNPKLNEPQFK